MHPPVKTLVLLTIFSCSLAIANAQIKLGPDNSIAAAIKTIINDYPNNFENLKGDLIIQNPQSADYECTVKLAGAEESVVTRFSGKKNFMSWHAVMLTTEDFNKAKRKFQSIYGDLNNLAINSSYVKGKYETPVEEKKFTSVLLALAPADELLKKLRIEIVMEAEGMDWKVKLLIYDRDRADDEQGTAVE